MKKLRIIYMGSPAVATPPLHYLLAHPACEVILVVSQPAKLVGRGRQKAPQDPEVAALAKEKGIMVLQPQSTKDPDFLAKISELGPDLAITCAYGKILSDAFLALPKRAVINIHPSALPEFRGATPVQQALLLGRDEIVVTVLFTVKALDAGNIIVQESFKVGADESSEELQMRLFTEASPLLEQAFLKLEDPLFVGTAQGEKTLSHCTKIAKEDGLVNWGEEAFVIYNKYKAFQPWPGSYSFFLGKRLLLEQMTKVAEPEEKLAPGAFIFKKQGQDSHLLVGTLKGAMKVTKLRFEGSSSNNVLDFWNRCKEAKPHVFGHKSDWRVR